MVKWLFDKNMLKNVEKYKVVKIIEYYEIYKYTNNSFFYKHMKFNKQASICLTYNFIFSRFTRA